MRWLNTLRGQFVTAIALAVILSSVAVIVILEAARQGEIRRVRSEAVAERVGASFALIAETPNPQRANAVRGFNSTFYTYELLPQDPLAGYVMSEEETAMAQLVRLSQESDTLAPVTVRFPPDTDVHRDDDDDGDGDNEGDGPGDRNRDRQQDRNADAVGTAPDITAPGAAQAEPNRERMRLRIREDDEIAISQAIGGGEFLTVSFEPPEVPRMAPDMLIAAILAAILTSAAAAWVAGRVSRPISALAAAADEVARGQKPQHLEPHGPDDVRRATEAFNTMAERVARTLESHRQLLSAVGHDLRTPLAAIRITAEFVKDEDVRGRLQRNVDELQALTEAVLSAVQSNGHKEMGRVDLASLIESLCDDLIELGEPVEVHIEGSAPVMCRSSDIRRAARNLIENAVRYGKRAHVTLGTAPDYYNIIIRDEGPGIPEDRLEDVFEAFVRLEESRSTTTGGSGLGLTLARTIAREHGGDVELRNRPEGGLEATLRLPREKASS